MDKFLTDDEKAVSAAKTYDFGGSPANLLEDGSASSPTSGTGVCASEEVARLSTGSLLNVWLE